MSLPSGSADQHHAHAPIRRTDGLLPKVLPEFSTLLVLVALWLGAMPAWIDVPVEDAVIWLTAIEAGTLMIMVTLVDIASRLKKPPPWWLGTLMIGGLLLLYPDLIGLGLAAWQLGSWVFLPLLWSLAERFRELWTLPGADRMEKIRRRALSWGRVGSAIVVAAVGVLILLGHGIVQDSETFDPDALLQRFALPLLALYFLINSYDSWRVYRPGFMNKPGSLWPFFDDGATARL
ncbi:MAG: hypothetical protein JJU31_12905 [Wenzhouxiangella sp.]|nr:hypothetical protein [Wenzhouxiangella sp.]